MRREGVLSTRRELVLGGTALAVVAPTFALLADSYGANQAPSPSDEWPQWAPTPTALYRRLEALAASKGKDLRSFGARLDGTSDDTPALEAAIASGAEAILVPAMPPGGAVRVTRTIELRRPIAIIGVGDKSVIKWEGEGDLFNAVPESGDPATFLSGIHVDRLRVVRSAGHPPKNVVLGGSNLRDVSVTRCSTSGMGTLMVHHLRINAVDKVPRGLTDPAVAAGFSAHEANDLNELILVYDNRVDGGSYHATVAVFTYARKVAVVGNTGRFANISWRGGGAKKDRGGMMDAMRRVRDVHITHNRLMGANGGIYGNCGDGILVAHNEISLMMDVGIDFEGCFNAVAHHNVVRNVGNFCYATFFAAKNIVFRDNFGLQDGSATNLHLRFGRKYGAMQGRALFAMRSGGFSVAPGAITVSLLDNHLVWRGPAGLGTLVPSYFSSLTMERNIFDNVLCPTSYVHTGRLVMTDNRLSFDRAADTPLVAISTSAVDIAIRDNEITCQAALPEGSIALLVRNLVPRQRAMIERNRVASAKGAFPIVIRGDLARANSVMLRANLADAILAQYPEYVVAQSNQDAKGRTLTPQPLPALYEQPVKPAPPSSDDSDSPAAPASASPVGSSAT